MLREIGVTLLLPDSWKGRYEVVEDTFAPVWLRHVGVLCAVSL